VKLYYVTCDYYVIMSNRSEEIKEFIKKSVDWQKFVNNAAALNFSGNKGNFFRAEEIENSIADFSNDKIKFIDGQGRDLYLTEYMEYIEVKCYNNSLYNKLGWKDIIKTIQLIRFRGDNILSELPDSYSRFIMILDKNCGVLVDKKEIKDYIIQRSDGLYLKGCPVEECFELYGPLECNILKSKLDLIINHYNRNMKQCRNRRYEEIKKYADTISGSK